MEIIRTHGMTKEAAKDRIEAQLPGLLSQFGNSVSDVRRQWQGDVMHFSFRMNPGGGIQGTLQVTDSHYILNAPLNLMQRMFERRARTAIERWLDENLPYS